jgi:hypothetical protein
MSSRGFAANSLSLQNLLIVNEMSPQYERLILTSTFPQLPSLQRPLGSASNILISVLRLTPRSFLPCYNQENKFLLYKNERQDLQQTCTAAFMTKLGLS